MPVPKEISNHPVEYERARAMAVERAHCWRVVDGDTLYAETDLGHHRTPDIAIRITGPDQRDFDAPEIYGVRHDSEEYRLGKEAQAFVEAILKGFPYTHGPTGPILHRPFEVGKFGRSVGRVWLPAPIDLIPPAGGPNEMVLTEAEAMRRNGIEYLWAGMAMLLVEHDHAEWEE